jgi:hypothetical protein
MATATRETFFRLLEGEENEIGNLWRVSQLSLVSFALWAALRLRSQRL